MTECRIAINGFSGRMGQAIYELSKKLNYNITVGCDLKNNLKDSSSLTLTDDLSSVENLFDVVIDFSLPNSTISLIEKCLKMKKPITIGTTGFNEGHKNIISSASKNIPIMVAPNMSLGVNSSLKVISDLSKILSDYEVSIEEIHHKNKVDSPSGTALKIAEVIAKSRNINPSDIFINSIREEGEIGIHTTTFKSNNDEIIIHHNALNRSIFAEGALKTAVWISTQIAGYYTYQDFMERT